jgi:hypothetical protein
MASQELFNKIFKSVDSTNDIPSFTKNVTVQHPYFGLAHFYSLKYSSTKELTYNITAAKTALFFSSIFYLQAQLKNEIPEQINLRNEENLLSAVFPENAEKKLVAIVEKEEIFFEPLHASDYFASQGIKLSEEALGADKLGKQLKSFTAWLKTMKKVHPDKLPADNIATETAVQTQAEKSNFEEEIVTEPMAEAYILQNKQAKAIDIYNKLSLLNPAKSAYFATKIESLIK